MCVQKVQRLIMSAVLALSFYFYSITSPLGPLLLGFVIVMIVVWGVTDFCPSIWILSKILPQCGTNISNEDKK